MGREEVEETARFVMMIDRFFDCLNVTDFDDGRRTRNPFKAPYRSGSDFRLRVSSTAQCAYTWHLVHIWLFPVFHVTSYMYTVAGRRVPALSWFLGKECGGTRRVFRCWEEQDEIEHRNTWTSYYRYVHAVHMTGYWYVWMWINGISIKLLYLAFCSCSEIVSGACPLSLQCTWCEILRQQTFVSRSDQKILWVSTPEGDQGQMTTLMHKNFCRILRH